MEWKIIRICGVRVRIELRENISVFNINTEQEVIFLNSTS